MIRPTERLKKFIEFYDNQRRFCEWAEMDEGMVSRLLNGERGATARQIEKVCKQIGWKLDEAWEIIEGDGKEDA